MTTPKGPLILRCRRHQKVRFASQLLLMAVVVIPMAGSMYAISPLKEISTNYFSFPRTRSPPLRGLAWLAQVLTRIARGFQDRIFCLLKWLAIVRLR